MSFFQRYKAMVQACVICSIISIIYFLFFREELPLYPVLFAVIFMLVIQIRVFTPFLNGVNLEGRSAYQQMNFDKANNGNKPLFSTVLLSFINMLSVVVMIGYIWYNFPRL